MKFIALKQTRSSFLISRSMVFWFHDSLHIKERRFGLICLFSLTMSFKLQTSDRNVLY